MVEAQDTGFDWLEESSEPAQGFRTNRNVIQLYGRYNEWMLSNDASRQIEIDDLGWTQCYAVPDWIKKVSLERSVDDCVAAQDIQGFLDEVNFEQDYYDARQHKGWEEKSSQEYKVGAFISLLMNACEDEHITLDFNNVPLTPRLLGLGTRNKTVRVVGDVGDLIGERSKNCRFFLDCPITPAKNQNGSSKYFVNGVEQQYLVSQLTLNPIDIFRGVVHNFLARRRGYNKDRVW